MNPKASEGDVGGHGVAGSRVSLSDGVKRVRQWSDPNSGPLTAVRTKSDSCLTRMFFILYRSFEF